MQISHEAIYYHIYIHAKPELKLLLLNQLHQKRKYKGNVRRGADKRTTIKDPIRIDERPKEVLGREISGHWEGGSYNGQKQGISDRNVGRKDNENYTTSSFKIERC